MRLLLVEIRYREPSYEGRHGRREPPYRWRYRVDVSSEAHATQLALDEFRRIEASRRSAGRAMSSRSA
jgi:hypothetical protein